MVWKPDFTSLRAEQVANLSPVNCLTKLINLVRHRQSVKSILHICGSASSLALVNHLLEFLLGDCTITLALTGSIEEKDLSEKTRTSVNIVAFAGILEASGKPDSPFGSTDVTIVDLADLGASVFSVSLTTLMTLVGDGG